MRLDLLEVTIYAGGDSTVRVFIAPEDWDKLFNSGYAYIDETNNERAITLAKGWGCVW
jgi:hypothetical protein